MTDAIDLEAIIERSTKLRPSTKRKYKQVARDWINYAGNRPGDWTPLKAQDFYDWLVRSKADGGGGLKINSAGGQFRGLQYVAKRYAILHGGLDFAAGIEMSRSAAREPISALSLDGARALLAACAGNDPTAVRDRAMITLGITTGARRGSITSVTIEGFGMITPNVGIPYQATSMNMKGGYSYNVPLCCYAVAACQAWRVWLHERAVKEGPLFRSVALPNVNGVRKIGPRALTEDGLYKSLAKRAEKAGIAEFHPHILRHTFVTWARMAKVPSEHVAAITGHSVGEDGARATVMDRVYFHKEAVAGAALASIESVFAPLFL